MPWLATIGYERSVFDDLLDTLRRHGETVCCAGKFQVVDLTSGNNAWLRDELILALDIGTRPTPEPDPNLRDYEDVPLGQDIEEYFAREVTPHVADARINREKRDEKDGEIGIFGHEINFNRHFYVYKPPQPLEEIEADIRTVEKEVAMLREVAA
jgi:hypothetical protein